MRDGSGTLIKYYGAANSAEAIVTVDRSLWRYTTIADLSLLSATPFAAKFGILFNSTEFSQHTVENVTVGFVRAAYGIVRGSGGNGEFTCFRNCDANQVGVFFYNNAGQAFTQRFEHCSCGLLAGGPGRRMPQSACARILPQKSGSIAIHSAAGKLHCGRTARM